MLDLPLLRKANSRTGKTRKRFRYQVAFCELFILSGRQNKSQKIGFSRSTLFSVNGSFSLYAWERYFVHEDRKPEKTMVTFVKEW